MSLSVEGDVLARGPQAVEQAVADAGVELNWDALAMTCKNRATVALTKMDGDLVGAWAGAASGCYRRLVEHAVRIGQPADRQVAMALEFWGYAVTALSLAAPGLKEAAATLNLTALALAPLSSDDDEEEEARERVQLRLSKANVLIQQGYITPPDWY